MKKAIIQTAIAAAIATAAMAPTSASAGSFNFSLGINGHHGGGYVSTHYYGHHHYRPRFKRFCKWKKRRVWSNYYGHYVWKKVRRCRIVRVRYY